MCGMLATLTGKNDDMIEKIDSRFDEVYGSIMGLNSKIGRAMEKINASLN